MRLYQEQYIDNTSIYFSGIITSSLPKRVDLSVVVGHPEPEKKSVGIFEYILASMLKVYLDVF